MTKNENENVVSFPGAKDDRLNYEERMKRIGALQQHLSLALAAMRSDGADNRQIILILRHAINDLETDRPREPS